MRKLTAILAMTLTITGLALLAQDSTSQPSPEGWTRFAVRDEVAPRFFTTPAHGQTLLGLAGQDSPSVNGSWRKTLPAAEGKYYAVGAQYQAGNVADPLRSLPVRLVWLDKDSKPVGYAEYPASAQAAAEDGWTQVAGTFQAPPKTAQARIELCLRWAARGEVLWRGVELKETAAPAPRKVRLATVSRYPRDSRKLEDNLQMYARDIAQAAAGKADIVCLGEAANCVGIGKPFVEMAEPIPGPTTEFLGKLAAQHKMYVVAGVIEKQGHIAYNACVLIGRDGKVAGKYRKMCLPDEEIEAGLCPGDSYPVFDTDFGRVGLMICWDLSYPEVARELCSKGAQVILMPIWGGEECLAKARAVENQVYLVASGYDFKSAIYDRTGKAIAQAAKDPRKEAEVLVREVDLSAPTNWPWIGDWRARIWRQAPGPVKETAVK